MKKARTVFPSLLLLIIFTASGALAQTASDRLAKPAVVKAAAPRTYPAIARAARASGKVVVRVTINQAGKVIAAKATSGHPLLQKVSVEAAQRWLFAAAEKKDEERFAELEFIYTIGNKEEEAGQFFLPPYQGEIVTVPSTLD
jgi:TonB family protein